MNVSSFVRHSLIVWRAIKWSFAILPAMVGLGCVRHHAPLHAAGAAEQQPVDVASLLTGTPISRSVKVSPVQATDIPHPIIRKPAKSDSLKAEVAVTLLEAARVAVWFARAVDLQSVQQVVSVHLETPGWGGGFEGAPVYIVEVHPLNGVNYLVVKVDAHSGDPVFAVDPTVTLTRSSLSPASTPTSSKQFEVWRSRLHLGGRARSNSAIDSSESYYFVAEAARFAEFQRGSVSRSQPAANYRSREARAGLKGLPRVSTDFPLYAHAMQYLKELGRTELEFDALQFDDGLQLSSHEDASMHVSPTGQLISFSSHWLRGSLESVSALTRGRKIILEQGFLLPHGDFEVEWADHSDNKVVNYRQRALGYPYLGAPVCQVQMAEGGVVTRYTYSAPQSPPAGLPVSTLPVSAVEAPVRAYMGVVLPNNTKQYRYHVTVKSLGLGWWTNPGSGRLRLCYDVNVEQTRGSDWSSTEGSKRYKFDAETGECLEKFP